MGWLILLPPRPRRYADAQAHDEHHGNDGNDPDDGETIQQALAGCMIVRLWYILLGLNDIPLSLLRVRVVTSSLSARRGQATTDRHKQDDSNDEHQKANP